MRLRACMLAEAAAAHEGRLFIHGGGTTRIVAPLLPWTQPQLAIVLQFEIDRDDAGPHDIGLAINQPNGDPLFPPGRVPVNVDRPEAEDGEDAFFHLALTLSPLTFQTEGSHTIEVSLDGEIAYVARLFVLEQPV